MIREGYILAVPKSERNESRTEYVMQSVKLASMVGQACSKLPKRWSFTRSQYVLNAVNRAMEEACRADSIYATNRIEANIRMEHLLEACASVYVTQGYINQLSEDNPKKPCDAGLPKEQQRPCISANEFAELGKQCALCIKLIKGVIRSDRRKWKVKSKPYKRTSSRRSR